MSPDELRRFLRAEFPLVDQHPDVAGLLRRADVLATLGPALAEPFRQQEPDLVLAPEARGPIVGALAARSLGCGLILARKQGTNHPGADRTASGGVGWRGSREVFQTRSFDLAVGDRVLLVDDWVTTGSSLRALTQVVELAGGHVVGASVIVDKPTAERSLPFPLEALVLFDEISGVAQAGR